MAKKDQCPLEDVESTIFANWLKLNGLENSGHIPNETPTKRPIYDEEGNKKWVGGWKTNKKNREMGVTKGIPDFLIFVPSELCTEDRSILLFVEMKRQNGVPSDVKPEQKRWLVALRRVEDVETFVAFGAESACKFVAGYLKSPKMFQF